VIASDTWKMSAISREERRKRGSLRALHTHTCTHTSTSTRDKRWERLLEEVMQMEKKAMEGGEEGEKEQVMEEDKEAMDREENAVGEVEEVREWAGETLEGGGRAMMKEEEEECRPEGSFYQDKHRSGLDNCLTTLQRLLLPLLQRQLQLLP